MKIATWNLERVKPKLTADIIDKLHEIDADIVILTETHNSIHLDGYHSIATSYLPAELDGVPYRHGEQRVNVLSKYAFKQQFTTYDCYTAVCVDVITPLGLLTVYGSIIGVLGNRQPRFDNDIKGHLSDFQQVFPGKQVCFAGDLNTTFSGRAWPSTKARQCLQHAFEQHQLTNTTAGLSDHVDHIVISNQLLQNKTLSIAVWNENKQLSDHAGCAVTIMP